MKTLTIEAIRENPWNVVSHALPTNPSPLLIAMAYEAADYCRKSETTLLYAIHKSDCRSTAFSVRTYPLDTCMGRIDAVSEHIRVLQKHCEYDDDGYVVRF